MQKNIKLSLLATMMFIATGCGNSSKDNNAAINDKKAELEKLKSSKTKTEEQIRQLQAELAKLDTNSANSAKIKLVAVTTVTMKDFKHFIDLQGKIDRKSVV